MLWPLLSHYKFRLQEIDIAADDTLIERYGARIPVLAVADGPLELDWPFSSQQVDEFFAKLTKPQCC